MIINIQDAKNHVEKDVTIQGWMYNKRGSGKIYFLQLRDGTGMMQAVAFKGDTPDNVMQIADELLMESSVKVTGKITQHPKKDDVFEMQVKDIEVVQMAKGEYPISKKEHGVDFLLENRHLWVRSKKQWATLRIRDEVCWAIRKYMRKNGFALVDAPILTKTACEDSTELFHVDYFEDDAYLSQSGQLYTEACEYSLGKTYCFGPTFRAEKSKTRRHLTEFWMVEPEMPFMKFDELLDFEEDFLYYILQSVLKNKRKELEILERDIEFLENIKKPFDRISYTEAIEILEKTGKSDIKWGEDFGGDDETILAAQFKGPILVHRFPKKITSFFMEADPDDDKVTLNVDLIGPEGYGEIIGGGAQRIGDYDLLKKRMEEHNLNMDEYEWYLDLLKYGGVPHCGFGMGLERCVAWICGTKHVRETIPFPRMMSRLTP